MVDERRSRAEGMGDMSGRKGRGALFPGGKVVVQ
jgi:hypothetical protein